MHPTPRVIHNCSLCTNRSHITIRKEQGQPPEFWFIAYPRTVWQNSYAEHRVPRENTFKTGGINKVNIIYQG